ncbi:hypothetical protein KIPB_017169, partial [Kipferlia bialata]
EFPELNPKEVVSKVAERYRALSKEDKAPFVKQYEKAKVLSL